MCYACPLMAPGVDLACVGENVTQFKFVITYIDFKLVISGQTITN